MDAKTKFTRDELLIIRAGHGYTGAGEYGVCALCRAAGWTDEIVHEPTCLLADDCVESVQLIGIRKLNKP